MTTDLKTEGQRLLLAEDGTNRELASTLSCSQAMIGHWRIGRRQPSDAMRKKLELALGIPSRSWDVAPGAPVPTSTASPPPPLPAEDELRADDDPLDIARHQLLAIRHQLEDTGLSASAAAKMRDTAAKLLALVSRLELARELQEDRVVRHHPEWQRVKGAILAALEPYPEAAEAVAKVLE